VRTVKKFVIILVLFPDLLFGQSRLAPNSAGGESKTLAQISGNRTAPPPAADAKGVVNALNFPGADMGRKITAALAAAYARGGGIIDARGFECPNDCHIGSENLVVGDGSHPVTLLLPTGKITRDLIPQAGRSAQILYNTHATMIGGGPGVTVISGPSDVTAVQQGLAPAGVSDVHFSGFSIQDSGKVVPDSVGFMVGGKNQDGSRGADVLSSTFRDMSIGGADIGTLLDSQHGCICYVSFLNVYSSGATVGIKTQNDSGYAFGVNSDQWTIGRVGGPIGLWDSGTAKFTWSYLDFESNKSSTGAILYAQQDGEHAGSGYAVGDQVRPLGQGTNAVLSVSRIGPEGSVRALQVSTRGAGYTNSQSAPTTALTGRGSGLKVDVRVSAYMLLISAGGSLIENPYEEAGGGDYICGTGNFVSGAFFSGNGATYSPTYCNGATGTYGGPASNFIWGPGATPNSLGLRNSHDSGPYIAFGSYSMFDNSLSEAYTSRASDVNLFADGPAYTGRLSAIYGLYAHSDWNEGLDKPHSGISSTGLVKVKRLPNPSAPVVTPSPRKNGDAGKPYTYSIVCNDRNGGVTSPSPFSASVVGPTELGAILTAVVRQGGAGYKVGDRPLIVGGDGAGQLTVTSVRSGGMVTAVSLYAAGSRYNTSPFPGSGGSNTFSTKGGSGSGLKVTLKSTFMEVTFPAEDGCFSWKVLKNGDTSHSVPGVTAGSGSTNVARNLIDFGAPVVAYSPPARNTTGDEFIDGNLSLGGTSATWSSGHGPPLGPCVTGSLYTNTRGVAGSTLYVCEAQKWAAK
jgi:hypothetical protein